MTRPAVGDPGPSFARQDTTGRVVRLEPGRHAATVAVVTANGCPFARAWHERIQRVAAGELAGPFLRDADQSAAQACGATATPEVFVVDRAGIVRHHGAPDGASGDPAQDAVRLREALDDVLAGREDVRVVARQVRNREEAARRGFPGSPTFQVGHRDLFPVDAPPALTCRVHTGPDGSSSALPAADDLAARLRAALARPWELPGWVDPRTPAVRRPSR